MWKPRFSQNNKIKIKKILKYFHENIIKYATFSDVKQNASQNSADFGGQDLPVKNILIRDYTIWPHFEKNMKVEKSWNLLTNPIINLLLTGFWENPKCCEKQWKNIWHNGK